MEGKRRMYVSRDCIWRRGSASLGPGRGGWLLWRCHRDAVMWLDVMRCCQVTCRMKSQSHLFYIFSSLYQNPPIAKSVTQRFDLQRRIVSSFKAQGRSKYGFQTALPVQAQRKRGRTT